MFPVRSCGKARPGLPEWPEERCHVSCEILRHRPWDNKTQNAFRLQNQERLPFCRVRSLSCGRCSQPGILSLHGLASSTREAMCLHYPDLLLYFKSIKECKLKNRAQIQISIQTSLSVPGDAAWCPGGNSSNKRKQEADSEDRQAARGVYQWPDFTSPGEPCLRTIEQAGPP